MPFWSPDRPGPAPRAAARPTAIGLAERPAPPSQPHHHVLPPPAPPRPAPVTPGHSRPARPPADRAHWGPHPHGHFQLSKQARAWFLLVDVLIAGAAAVMLLAVSLPGHSTHHTGLHPAAAPAPVASALLVSRQQSGAPTATSPVPPNAVIIGDSNAWLWQLYAPGIPDLGRIGWDSAQISGLIPAALAYHPKYVVMTAGTIDIMLGSPWQNIATLLQSMANQVKAGGATPVFVTIQSIPTAMQTRPWIGIGLWPYSVGPTVPLQGQANIPGLNAAIEKMGYPYLNVPPDSETIDGEHLNATGYADLNKQLAAIIGPLPAANSAFPAQTAPAGGVPPKNLIIGDAGAWLWQLYAPPYPSFARIGEDTAQVAASLPAALALHPRNVVIDTGSSDLIEGATWQETAAQIQAIVNQVKAAGATPIVTQLEPYGTTMLTSPWVGLGLWSPAVGASVGLPGGDQVAALNDAITKMGVAYLGAAPIADTFDGIHLGSPGYAVLSHELDAINGG